MLFNSFAFILLFLPATAIGFFVLGRCSALAAAAWLMLASLFFYGWWNVNFLALLVPSIVGNYFAGLLLAALCARGRYRATRVALAVAVGANLLVLGYFKYFDFLVGSINAVADAHLPLAEIVLPLGISFFTFTQIAFLVDASRGEVTEVNPIHYGLFVSYFPHLIAGPILHHREMMPQFRDPETYRLQAANSAVGISYFAIGLFKKCVLADGFAPDAELIFHNAGSSIPLGMGAAWLGALAYTLQLYFDFSGYSDMAIGLSRMFGVRLPLNFASPYRSASIIEFWRRWHMTLSRFLRDYLYFPLGGNCKGPTRRHINLMVTMLLGGLWHGANWTFVIWGGLHGIYLVINHLWRGICPTALRNSLPAPARRALAVAVTFLAVVVAWVFFRAPDLTTAMKMLASMAGLHGLTGAKVEPGTSEMILHEMNFTETVTKWLEPLRYVVGLVVVFGLPNTQEFVEKLWIQDQSREWRPMVPLYWQPNALWGGVLGAMFVAAIVTFAHVSKFLYFQF
jgi:alginate O-acetyltransferase complex protein AlgI